MLNSNENIIKVKKKIKNTNEKLEKLIDIAPPPVSTENIEIIPYQQSEILEICKPTETQLVPDFEKDFIDDYETSRAALLKLLKDTDAMIRSIMMFASEGESARVYEVAGILMKTRADISMQLIELQKTRIEIQKKDSEFGTQVGGNGKTNIQNAVIFQGTTQDVLDNIKKSKNLQ